MRFLLSFRVDNGMTMSLVADTHDMVSAKALAVQLSSSLFKDEVIRVKPHNKLVHSERWGKDKNMQYRPGTRTYGAAFIFNGTPQFITTDGNGIKSAFNNIIMKFGIDNAPNMLIYEIGQVYNRKNALVKARNTIKNNKELSELVRQTITKFKQTPSMQVYWGAFNELLVLLKEYKTRQYTNVNAEKIIMLIAVMIYIVDPSKYSLEYQGYNSIESAIEMIINVFNDDIAQYKSWLAGEQSGNIVLC